MILKTYDDAVNLWRLYLNDTGDWVRRIERLSPVNLFLVYQVVDQGGGLPTYADGLVRLWRGGKSAILVVYERKGEPPFPSKEWKKLSRSLIPPSDYTLSLNHPNFVQDFTRILNLFLSSVVEGPTIVFFASGFNSLKRYERIKEIVIAAHKAKRKHPVVVVLKHGDIGLVPMKSSEWESYEEFADFVFFSGFEKLYMSWRRYKFHRNPEKYIPGAPFSTHAAKLLENEPPDLCERPGLNLWMSGMFLWRHPWDYYNFVDEKWIPYLHVMTHSRKEFHPSFNIGKLYHAEALRRFPEFFKPTERVRGEYRISGGSTFRTPDKIREVMAQFRSILWKSTLDGGPGCLQVDMTPMDGLVFATPVITDNHKFYNNPFWRFDGKNHVLIPTGSVSEFEEVLEVLNSPVGCKELWRHYMSIREKYGFALAHPYFAQYLLMRAAVGTPITFDVDEEAIQFYCSKYTKRRKKDEGE